MIISIQVRERGAQMGENRMGATIERQDHVTGVGNVLSLSSNLLI